MHRKKKEIHSDNAFSLRREAEEIRRVAVDRHGPKTEGLAPWQRIVVMPLLLLALVTSTVLLTSGDLRKNILERIAGPWLAALDQSLEIYRLPPPPPRLAPAELSFSTQPRIPPAGPMVPVVAAVLELETSPTEVSDDFEPEEKTKQWEEAFRVLEAESEVVARLLAGEVSGLRFEGWEPLQANPPRYSVKLDMYSESDLRRITFAWSVDVSGGETRPENQAARDLFFKFQRP